MDAEAGQSLGRAREQNSQTGDSISSNNDGGCYYCLLCKGLIMDHTASKQPTHAARSR